MLYEVITRWTIISEATMPFAIAANSVRKPPQSRAVVLRGHSYIDSHRYLLLCHCKVAGPGPHRCLRVASNNVRVMHVGSVEK